METNVDKLSCQNRTRPFVIVDQRYAKFNLGAIDPWLRMKDPYIASVSVIAPCARLMNCDTISPESEPDFVRIAKPVSAIWRKRPNARNVIRCDRQISSLTNEFLRRAPIARGLRMGDFPYKRTSRRSPVLTLSKRGPPRGWRSACWLLVGFFVGFAMLFGRIRNYHIY